MSRSSSSHPQVVPADPTPASLRAIDPVTRRQVLTDFFGRWPGTHGALGLGRALYDFQEWEISSGRIRALGGSGWWAAVNGALVADLDAARRHLCGGDARPLAAGARAWVDYATAVDTGQTLAAVQDALWRAHQLSVSAGAGLAHSSLEAECRPERDFAQLVLAVVDEVAQRGTDTSTDELDQLTRRHYPQNYPVDEATVDALVALLSRHPDQSGSR